MNRAVLVAGILFIGLLLAGCASGSPLGAPSSSQGSMTSTSPTATSASTTAPPVISTSSTTSSLPTSANSVVGSLPLRKPVEILRQTSNPWIFNPELYGNQIAYLQVTGVASPLPQDLPNDAVLHLVDIASKKVSTVTAARLSVPAFKNGFSWPAWYVGVLPSFSKGGEPQLLWTTQDPDYMGNAVPRYDGLWRLLPDGTAGEVLPTVTLLLPPFPTGDFLALPVSSAAYENAHQGNVGTTLGERLLLLDEGGQHPISVDPTAPRLSPAELGDRSPYVCWFGPYHRSDDTLRLDLAGHPPKVFDLRRGKPVDIEIDAPRTPIDYQAVAVAGKWVVWLVYEGDPQAPTEALYLADLETGKASRVASGASLAGLYDLALTRDWLLWVDSASKALVGFHLPDLQPVRIEGALLDGRRGSVGVAGNLALVQVTLGSPADDVITSMQILPSALVVIRLK